MPHTLGWTFLGFQRSGVLGQEEVRSLENCSHFNHSPVHNGFPPEFLVQTYPDSCWGKRTRDF